MSNASTLAAHAGDPSTGQTTVDDARIDPQRIDLILQDDIAAPTRSPARRRSGDEPSAEELRRLYVDKQLSLDDIAERYGIPPWTVQRWLAALKPSRRVPAWATVVSAEHLRALYVDQGLTLTQIVQREQVSPSVVWYALQHHQIPTHPRGRPRIATHPSADELRRRYLEQGWSTRRLAAHYQASTPIIRRWLADAGIPRRPVGFQPVLGADGRPRTRHRRPKRVPRPPADELRRLYVDQDLPVDDLADRYGVTSQTLRNWLRAAHIRRARRARQSWSTSVSAEHLRGLYVEQGLTLAEIGEREHVSPGMVWYAMRRHQIPRRRPFSPGANTPRRRHRPPPTQELRRLYLEEHRSIRQLAAHYDVSYCAAHKWLANAEIPRRPPGGYARWHGRRQGASHAAATR
jgi:transposase